MCDYGLVSTQTNMFKQRALTCGPYRGVLGLLGQVFPFDCTIFMTGGQYMRTRERLRCVCFRMSEGGQSPCIPPGTIFLNLWWLGAGKERTVERMLPEFSWFERERPSELWEFPQNLKTHLSDLKSYMPPTRSHLWELKPSSKTVQGGDDINYAWILQFWIGHVHTSTFVLRLPNTANQKSILSKRNSWDIK